MNLNKLFINCIKTRSQIVNYQIVRWRRNRKPFWLGMARSKMFVLPKVKPIPPEETKEQDRLKEEYLIQVKSILHFIRATNPNLSSSDADAENAASENLLKEIERSYELNESFNAYSASLREERLKREKDEMVEVAMKTVEEEENVRRNYMKLVEEVVEKEKVLSQSYITPENLEEAIDKCLTEIVSYDFAIDLKGNKYPGRVSLPATKLQKSNTETQVHELNS